MKANKLLFCVRVLFNYLTLCWLIRETYQTVNGSYGFGKTLDVIFYSLILMIFSFFIYSFVLFRFLPILHEFGRFLGGKQTGYSLISSQSRIRKQANVNGRLIKKNTPCPSVHCAGCARPREIRYHSISAAPIGRRTVSPKHVVGRNDHIFGMNRNLVAFLFCFFPAVIKAFLYQTWSDLEHARACYRTLMSTPGLQRTYAMPKQCSSIWS